MVYETYTPDNRAIDKFFADLRKGHISGPPADKDTIPLTNQVSQSSSKSVPPEVESDIATNTGFLSPIDLLQNMALRGGSSNRKRRPKKGRSPRKRVVKRRVRKSTTRTIRRTPKKSRGKKRQPTRFN
jgi:hypothetical protein